MITYKVKEYKRKDRNTTSKQINLGKDSNFTNNDEVVILSVDEYQMLKDAKKNAINPDAYVGEITNLKNGLAGLENENQELRKEKDQAIKNLEQFQESTNQSTNQINLLSETNLKLENELRDLKKEIEIYKGQSIELTQISIEHSFLLQELEKANNLIESMENKQENLEEEIAGLYNKVETYKDDAVYHRFIYELLLNRGLLDRIRNKDIRNDTKINKDL